MFFKNRFFLISAAILLSALLFTGCKNSHSPAVFGYTSYDARFNAVFPSDHGDVECRVTRENGALLLEIISPERSAEMRVICSPDRCVLIPCGGEEISISSAASENLTKLFDIMYRGSNGGEKLTRTEDGVGTVISYEDGAVTVGADMLPTSVEIFGDNGRRISINNYEVSVRDGGSSVTP